MSRSVLFAENFFSVTQFPSHTIAADEEAAGHEIFRLADGRRSAYDYYEAATANTQRTLTVTCNQVRGADMIALDRGHNLAGKQIVLECSDDGFVTPAQTVFSIVLPTVSVAANLSDLYGVRTEEGAWLKRFPFRAAVQWRLRIPAMGASLKPRVVGLQLGQSYACDAMRPVASDADELVVAESMSDLGWRGSSAPANVRGDTLVVKLPDLFEEQVTRYHLGHFARRRPMWYVPDDENAQRAVCTVRPAQQSLGLALGTQWFGHEAHVVWVEHEPMAVA